MRRLLLLLVLTGGLTVVAPGAAHACSCVSAGPRQYVEWADAVVWAGVRDVQMPVGGNGVAHYLLDVEAVYKGDVTERVRVDSSASGAACGLEGIDVGQRHVFFLSRARGGQGLAGIWGVPDGAWTASLCDGSGWVDRAELERVAPAVQPSAGPPGPVAQPPSPGGPSELPPSAYSHAGMVSGGLLAVGAGAIWVRRVRRGVR